LSALGGIEIAQPNQEVARRRYGRSPDIAAPQDFLEVVVGEEVLVMVGLA
jgi:hypothetical protein